jgi:DNA repair protein RecN (Recombination protein N)
LLRKLIIQNYAIIDEISIDFSDKLNIITGETGAGKSILMGALGLILGDRADTSVLVNTEKKCFIEGYFSVDNKVDVIALLKEMDLESDEELILRREIGTNGKSRAFINDTPTTLQQLKKLASYLVDLHQQFDTLELGDSDFQREVIDALAGNDAAIRLYRKSFFVWQTKQRELQALKDEKTAFLKEFDYNQYLYNELEELDLKENELENIDEELKVLNNSEDIKAGIQRVYVALNEDEQPIVVQLKQLINQLSAFSGMNHELPDLIERMKAAQVELKDVADELERLNSNIFFDDKRIEWINQRLSDGYKLLKKHNVKTTAELLQLKDTLSDSLQNVLQIDDAIQILEKDIAERRGQLEREAAIISRERARIIAPFERDVNVLLKQVGMPNALIQVRLIPSTLYEFGVEQVELLFDANNNNRFEPIRKVASGGELSRLMLCIKSLVAESIDLATLIFDEIDTGISGEAAKQVGLIMKNMSAKRQIICITHQPQIAGKANAHYYVYKDKKADKIQTTIRRLTDEERIHSIAQMLSGEQPTAAALDNAREMINN